MKIHRFAHVLGHDAVDLGENLVIPLFIVIIRHIWMEDRGENYELYGIHWQFEISRHAKSMSSYSPRGSTAGEIAPQLHPSHKTSSGVS